jgi:hypothetical protein
MTEQQQKWQALYEFTKNTNYNDVDQLLLLGHLESVMRACQLSQADLARKLGLDAKVFLGPFLSRRTAKINQGSYEKLCVAIKQYYRESERKLDNKSNVAQTGERQGGGWNWFRRRREEADPVRVDRVARDNNNNNSDDDASRRAMQRRLTSLDNNNNDDANRRAMRMAAFDVSSYRAGDGAMRMTSMRQWRRTNNNNNSDSASGVSTEESDSLQSARTGVDGVDDDDDSDDDDDGSYSYEYSYDYSDSARAAANDDDDYDYSSYYDSDDDDDDDDDDDTNNNKVNNNKQNNKKFVKKQNNNKRRGDDDDDSTPFAEATPPFFQHFDEHAREKILSQPELAVIGAIDGDSVRRMQRVRELHAQIDDATRLLDDHALWTFDDRYFALTTMTSGVVLLFAFLNKKAFAVSDGADIAVVVLLSACLLLCSTAICTEQRLKVNAVKYNADVLELRRLCKRYSPEYALSVACVDTHLPWSSDPFEDFHSDKQRLVGRLGPKRRGLHTSTIYVKWMTVIGVVLLTASQTVVNAGATDATTTMTMSVA